MRQNLLTWTDPSASTTAAGGSDSDSSSPPSPAATTAVPNNSMCFSFPLTVARDTASILASLPPKAVEVHGMGIMEKIFEIGSWCVNVLGACESVGFSTAGMDLTAGDLGLIVPGCSGRKSATLDPIEFFVRTLSASPNSRTQFAERLLRAAGDNPGCMRVALSPSIGMAGFAGAGFMGPGSYGTTASSAAAWSQGGSVIGELAEEREEAEAARGLDLAGTSMSDISAMGGLRLDSMASVDIPPPVGMTGVESIDMMSPLEMTTSYTHSQNSQGYPDGSNGGMGGTMFASWSGWTAAGTHEGSLNGVSPHGNTAHGEPRSGNQGMSDETAFGSSQEGDSKRKPHGMVGVW